MLVPLQPGSLDKIKITFPAIKSLLPNILIKTLQLKLLIHCFGVITKFYLFASTLPAFYLITAATKPYQQFSAYPSGSKHSVKLFKVFITDK